MLLGGTARDHSHDDVGTLCKGYVLVGEVVVGLDVRSDYVPGGATENETEETLSRFVEVAGKCQPFIEGGIGGPQGERTPIHDSYIHYSNRRRTRLLFVLSLAEEDMSGANPSIYL